MTRATFSYIEHVPKKTPQHNPFKIIVYILQMTVLEFRNVKALT